MSGEILGGPTDLLDTVASSAGVTSAVSAISGTSSGNQLLHASATATTETNMERSQQLPVGAAGTLRDPDSESSEESDLDEGELIAEANQDELTSQLASAGTVGIAAAAAVTTVRKRGRSKWAFETNPAVRKRQQTRLLRRLRSTLDEMQARVGQQCVVLAASPGKALSSNTFKCFGATALETVVKTHQDTIMQDLENSLDQFIATNQQPIDPDKHELPPLVIDGIPTPLNKMTQAQLRAFIPLMLKYSTGRPKPGWGKDDMRPMWWPDGLPWQNVRADMRSDNEKQQTQWTEALRQIVRNCYTHHNRLDLLLETTDDPIMAHGDLEGDQQQQQQQQQHHLHHHQTHHQHHHNELDMGQMQALPEQTQVILDLAQHPQLIQHIQAADGTAMLLPQYLDSGQMVISLATDSGQVGVDPHVVATLAIASANNSVSTVSNTTTTMSDVCDPLLSHVSMHDDVV